MSANLRHSDNAAFPLLSMLQQWLLGQVSARNE